MKIFLFDPTCLSYRIHVYDFFKSEFEKAGYELTIFYDKNEADINKEGYQGIEYSFSSFRKLHIEEKPKVSIYFIWLSYMFSLPFLLYSKLFLSAKSIVWSKGINIAKIDQTLMNQFYYLRQRLADGLILYSDFEVQFIKSDLKKVFVANNTINQHVYNVAEGDDNQRAIKEKYGIKEDKVVLFVGRIQERKRLDLLVDIFSHQLTKHALVIVGPGMGDDMAEKINNQKNIYYPGPIYDINELSSLYSLADIFCIPGEIGLGINEAFLFGLPVVTTFIRHTSEMELLFQNNKNGLLFKRDDKSDLLKKLTILLEDDQVYKMFSDNAKKTFEEKAKIEYMRDGFLKSINFVLNK
ncbi:glycosyltransferase family 4 protein [bacterium]|nr:glycosyltransferase family 4 protein [bacterium]